MGERMGETEIDEIVGDSELVNNDFIAIEDFAKMIMNRIWAPIYNRLKSCANINNDKVQRWLPEKNNLILLSSNLTFEILS